VNNLFGRELITIDKEGYQGYKEQLLQLYLDSFSKGLSAQTLNSEAVGQYLDSLFTEGYGIIIVEGDVVIGALLATSLRLDVLLPDKIRQNFLVEDCVYIAEMMVTENARGKGLGKQLLLEFIQTVDKIRFKHAFIRVWVDNIPAVALYRKMGYQDYAFINQMKTNPVTNELFVMHKVYLYRNLS
jgi:ribosomal protein S18 acetylase RimI-like enzyme